VRVVRLSLEVGEEEAVAEGAEEWYLQWEAHWEP